MDHDGKLPPLDEATTADRLTVLARLDLFVGPDPIVPVSRVAQIESARHVELHTGADGCVTARASDGNELVLRIARPGTFRVRGDGVLGLRLRDTASRAEGEIVASVLPPEREQVLPSCLGLGTTVQFLVDPDHPEQLEPPLLVVFYMGAGQRLIE